MSWNDNIKRRIAIRNLIFLAGGVILIRSCTTDAGKPSLPLDKLDITSDDEQLLATLTDIIIPRTDTPGAAELGCHLYILKMLNDCAEKDAQQKFMHGLRELKNDIQERFRNPLDRCSKEQQIEVVADLENRKNFSSGILGFYDVMKERLIQGYLTSKFVLIDIQHYQIIPAVPYNGYYRINHA